LVFARESALHEEYTEFAAISQIICPFLIGHIHCEGAPFPEPILDPMDFFVIEA
jgi:hypothetical protein